MSVWPAPAFASLSSNEGELLLVSVAVEPRRLESVLETLAQLNFPVNPQIYHEGSLAREGDAPAEPESLVEFPAYEIHLEEVRQAFSDAGFRPQNIHAVRMLDEIHFSRIAVQRTP